MGYNLDASNHQSAPSGATGGALDAQARFSFGGITTTGTGGSTSTSQGTQSYIAMAIIAAAVVAVAYLFLKR